MTRKTQLNEGEIKKSINSRKKRKGEYIATGIAQKPGKMWVTLPVKGRKRSEAKHAAKEKLDEIMNTIA